MAFRITAAGGRYMNHAYIDEQTAAFTVMNLGQGEVTQFVADCLRQRSLSKVIARLNHELLNGSAAEREEAQNALNRLGFL